MMVMVSRHTILFMFLCVAQNIVWFCSMIHQSCKPNFYHKKLILTRPNHKLHNVDQTFCSFCPNIITCPESHLFCFPSTFYTVAYFEMQPKQLLTWRVNAAVSHWLSAPCSGKTPSHQHQYQNAVLFYINISQGWKATQLMILLLMTSFSMQAALASPLSAVPSYHLSANFLNEGCQVLCLSSAPRWAPWGSLPLGG